ncbi:DUF1680-domain-containing protein [Tothia fuscella]|uniref:DUF1680-domain-containing protein n=1 Tax=Tothia fuscella TaxID=1048955 RepID=A0A9P4TZA8_9PEZI|nr:DUF1680-domain-containing protein [Tothia fuscella]
MSYPQLSFTNTSFAPDSFISKKRNVVFKNTIPYQLKVLRDTGTYDAYKLKWRESYRPDPEHWPVPADFHLFWDSDIAKWIESACYSLHEQKNDEIENAIHELVEMMSTAQRDDGYLNIHYIVVEPEKRFTNLRDMHELYNCGHLIEAALAHHDFFRNNRFLDIMLKYVDLLCKTFGPGVHQKHGYPGHPELELALLRLHAVTGDPKHLALGKYFIEERGNPKGVDGQHYYTWEAAKRGERLYERPATCPARNSYWYQQAHKPIADQTTIEGHSVRAVYLLTGVADLQHKKAGGQDYATALKKLWKNMVEKRMYPTGGIGAIDQWEGFGIDYFLPQSTDEGGCYAETCASIGVMMLAERLLQLEFDSEYADIMELSFYNAVLGGMSCDGKKFSYENQLASSAGKLSERKEWFTCACCPPNVSRLLGSIGGYMWSHKYEPEVREATIRIHMFGSATLSFGVGGDDQVGLTQMSNWPWEGEVKFTLTAPIDVSISIDLRIPGWADEWKITPTPPSTELERGYLNLPTTYLKANPHFVLDIPIKARFLSPHPFTNQNTVTIARGSIIYCIEDADNPWVEDHFKTLLFDSSKSHIKEAQKTDKDTGESYIALIADGGACSFIQMHAKACPGILSGAAKAGNEGSVDELHFVPFYYRANRKGKGQMRVGLRKQ